MTKKAKKSKYKRKQRKMNRNPTGKGGFQKGVSGNPKGRNRKQTPKRYSLQGLVKAIRKVERQEKKRLYEELVRRALKSDKAAGIVIKRLIPDLKAIESLVGVVDGRMSKDEAAEVRKKLRDRFQVTSKKDIELEDDNADDD